ncbi:MAG: hypothetical protein ACE5FF_08135 [Saprospiraceae bacterium]
MFDDPQIIEQIIACQAKIDELKAQTVRKPVESFFQNGVIDFFRIDAIAKGERIAYDSYAVSARRLFEGVLFVA